MSKNKVTCCSLCSRLHAIQKHIGHSNMLRFKSFKRIEFSIHSSLSHCSTEIPYCIHRIAKYKYRYKQPKNREKFRKKTTISATFCQRIKTTKQHSGFTNYQNAKIPVQKSRTLEKLKIIFCSPLSTIYIGVSRYYEIEILSVHAFACYTNRFMLLFISTYGWLFFWNSFSSCNKFRKDFEKLNDINSALPRFGFW